MEISKLIGCVNVPVRFGPKIADNYGPLDFLNNTIAILISVQKYYSGNQIQLMMFYNNEVKNMIVKGDTKVAKLRKKSDLESILTSYSRQTKTNYSKRLDKKYMRLGSDPELFIEHNGRVVPSFEYLPSKKTPIESEYNQLYWDGYQAEFTTRADTCLSWVVDSVQNGLKQTLRQARMVNPDYKISTQTTMDIPFARLEADKDEHVSFGCMPSLNAYGMKGITGDGRNVGFRSAGGHIHFGLVDGMFIQEHKLSVEQADRIVKALDAILGVASVSLFAGYDNPVRRTMYGLAGEYRLPPHGLEYRVLSNAWMFHPLTMNIVFELARNAAIFGFNGFIGNWEHDEAETIKIINTCDVEGARKVLEKNKDVLKGIIQARTLATESDMVVDMIMKGVDAYLPNFKDVESNWHLSTNKWIGHCEAEGCNISNFYAMIKKQQAKVG